MLRILYMSIDAAISAIILTPLFLLLNPLLFHSGRRTFCYLLFAVYLSGMFSVVGLPDICYVRFDPSFNLIPFSYMFSDSINSILNVLLFIPLGVFLPCFWKFFRKMYRTVLFGFCTSLLVEVLQIFTLRATDVNDLITNTIGTLLGWCIARLLLLLFPSITPSRKTGNVYLVCGLTFVVMFFLHPFLADWLCPFL